MRLPIVALILGALAGTATAQVIYGTQPPSVSNVADPWMFLEGQPYPGATATSFTLTNGPAFATAYVAVSLGRTQATIGSSTPKDAPSCTRVR